MWHLWSALNQHLFIIFLSEYFEAVSIQCHDISLNLNFGVTDVNMFFLHRASDLRVRHNNITLWLIAISKSDEALVGGDNTWSRYTTFHWNPYQINFVWGFYSLFIVDFGSVIILTKLCCLFYCHITSHQKTKSHHKMFDQFVSSVSHL